MFLFCRLTNFPPFGSSFFLKLFFLLFPSIFQYFTRFSISTRTHLTLSTVCHETILSLKFIGGQPHINWRQREEIAFIYKHKVSQYGRCVRAQKRTVCLHTIQNYKLYKSSSSVCFVTKRTRAKKNRIRSISISEIVIFGISTLRRLIITN